MEGYLKLKNDQFQMFIAMEQEEWSYFQFHRKDGIGLIECKRILKNGEKIDMVISLSAIDYLIIKNQEQ